MDTVKKIYFTSCETGENAWRCMEDKLEKIYHRSVKKYVLVDDPLACDLILIGDAREENWGEKVLRNPLLQRFPSKCFSLSEQNKPLVLHHGIYSNLIDETY